MALIPTGGIKDRNVNRNARIRSSKLADGVQSLSNPNSLFPGGQRLIGGLSAARFFPGTDAFGILRVASDVVEGETVTIGPILIDGVEVTDIFEVDIVNTDSTQNTSGGEWNNTNDPIMVTVPAHGRAAGDLLRVESEIVKVLRVIDVNTLVVARGRSGTTTAAHADALDIFVSATPPASNIPVGLVATLTPAVFTPALVDEIINALSGNERATAKASRIYKLLTATSFQAGAEMLLEARNPGVLTTALAETLAGANNVWDTAALRGGAEPAFKREVVFARVPNATEVALAAMRFPIDFTPIAADVWVITTATGIEVAWNGARTLAAGLVTVDNSGATDWTAAETVFVIAYEG